ncbi:MAG TPA: S41 family peptidase [Rhizomicrobium sp.]|nr:S41 family peptidase [Rhizomicrobium sp.]
MKTWTLAAIACAAANITISITIPCQAQIAPVAAATQAFGQAEKRAVIEKAGELLTANYIYPDRAADAKTKLDAALMAGEYAPTTTPEALAEKLTSDLQSVTHDKHLHVYPPPAPRPRASAATAPAPQRVYAGFSRVDRLKGNIGYIKMQNFPDPAGPFSQTAAQAIADLAGTDALIIDMRDNRGGSTAGVIYLCSFFFDPKTAVHIDGEVTRKSGTSEFQTKEIYTQPVPVSYLGKPVYLLTSKRTYSAAEKFLYDLQTQNRARLIGEATGGSANGTASHPLPSKFMISIPYQRTVNPITNTNFEGTGVKPDLAVEETLAFQAAMREIVASNPAKYAALKAEVESQSAEDAFVEASLLKFRDQPQPGGEAAVRGLLSGIASGKPDYAQMSEELAQIVKDDFDFFHTDMREMGEAKSVKFIGVNARGLDDYEVRTATATKRFAIYLGPNGKIVAAGFYPTVPLPSQP